MFVTRQTQCGTCHGTGKITTELNLPNLDIHDTLVVVAIVRANRTNKIMGIKLIRERLYLGLKESKELYEHIADVLDGVS